MLMSWKMLRTSSHVRNGLDIMRCLLHRSCRLEAADGSTNKPLRKQSDWKAEKNSVVSNVKSSQSVRGRSWNVPPAVQRRLRNDVLKGPRFSETLFDRFAQQSETAHGAVLLESIKASFSGKNENQQIQSLTTKDVKAIMVHFGSTERNVDQKEKETGILEEICLLKFKSFSIAEQLLLVDIFYTVGYQPQQYLRTFLKHLASSWERLPLTLPMVLQVMFYIGIYRNAPVDLSHKIECFLVSHTELLSGGDVGLVAHAFFASNHSVSNYVLQQRFAKIVLRDLHQMALYQVCNVMKLMRHSGFNGHAFYKSLGDLLCETNLVTADSSPSNVANICSAYASLRICHSPLFAALADHMINLISRRKSKDVRLKDLSRILWSYRMLQEPLPGLIQNELIQQLSHGEGLEVMYPEIYIEALCALAMGQRYLLPQINNVLTPSYVKFKTGRILEQNHQLLLIDEAVGVEADHYQGRRLSQDVVARFTQEKSNSRGLALHTRTGLAATWLGLQDLLGQSSVKCHYIFNFSFLPDLELRLGGDGRLEELDPGPWSSQERTLRTSLEEIYNRQRQKSQAPPDGGVLAELLREHNHGARAPMESIHLKPEKSNGQRKISVKILSENQLAVNDARLLGFHQMELRLLTKRGYEVLAVNPGDARRLHTADASERRQLLRNLILNPLDISA